MDGPREYHIQWGESGQDKYYITYMWNLNKYNTNESVYKVEINSQT